MNGGTEINITGFQHTEMSHAFIFQSKKPHPVLFDLDLHMKYSRGGPSMYLYCVVCYCVIEVPCVRSVFSLFLIIQNDTGLWAVLLPEVFFFDPFV